jgi:hypothetical protein
MEPISGYLEGTRFWESGQARLARPLDTNYHQLVTQMLSHCGTNPPEKAESKGTSKRARRASGA